MFKKFNLLSIVTIFIVCVTASYAGRNYLSLNIDNQLTDSVLEVEGDCNGVVYPNKDGAPIEVCGENIKLTGKHEDKIQGAVVFKIDHQVAAVIHYHFLRARYLSSWDGGDYWQWQPSSIDNIDDRIDIIPIRNDDDSEDYFLNITVRPAL